MGDTSVLCCDGLGNSAPGGRKTYTQLSNSQSSDTASRFADRCLTSLVGMLARATTFTIDGVRSRPVTVEVDIRPGLPAFTIVGLGDIAVRESRERVRSAILNSGYEFPPRRITANLAPASLRKAGPGFDAAIALGVLAASGQLGS